MYSSTPQDEFSQMLKGSVFSSQAAVGALLMTDEKEFHDLIADVKSNAKDSGPRLEALVDNIFKEVGTDLFLSK